jgi:hypothetical protein
VRPSCSAASATRRVHEHHQDARKARHRPEGIESEGLFQADLFLSRPEADVRHQPLEEIVTVTSGRNKTVGPRFVRFETCDGMQVALEP